MTRIQMRRGTAAAWTAANPILAAGEHGFETDTGKEKIGNGATAWVTLPYLTDTLGVNAVAKDTLVINVLDHGVIGNNTADDTTAINAILDTAKAVIGTTVRFPAVATGYKTTAPVLVPAGVNIDMWSPIIYAGAGGETALTVGYDLSTQQRHRRHRIMVKRATISSWTDDLDIGVVIRNHFAGDIEIAQVESFTIGAQLLGDANGVVYNRFRLGIFNDNKVGLELTTKNTGWTNENLYLGGEFTNASSTYNSIDRIGIRITSTEAYYNNNNYFLKPSFEIKGGSPAIAAEGLCFDARYAIYNTIVAARSESPDAVSLRQSNDSTSNSIGFGFNLGGTVTPVVDDAGTRSSGILSRSDQNILEIAQRLVYSTGPLHKSACWYNGSTELHMPGVVSAVSTVGSNTDKRAWTGNDLLPTYVEIGTGRIIGVYISTRTLKRFTLISDTETGFGGRWTIRCYDSGGSILSAASTVRTNSSGAFAYATSYNGAWRTSADSNGAKHVGVSAATDYAFVGIGGGTAVCRIRSFSIYTPDITVGPTWLHVNDSPGVNYGTTPPTIGTWEVGREIKQAVPAVGSPKGWLCTVAGTPGTWVSTGNL